MIIGTLNRRIVVQQLAAGVDAIGQPVQTWTTFGTVWANIRNQTGAEAIRSGSETSTVKASIRIRKRAGIDAGMRVLHGSKVYEIKAVLPDLDHTDLVCEVMNAQS